MRFKLNNSIKFYLLSLMLLVTLVVISCGFETSHKTEKKKKNIKVQPIEVDSLIPLVSPESLGISKDKLEEIDRIVQNAIKSRALPGAQVVAMYDGKMFYRKSFGTLMYNEDEKVTDDMMYDIASVTKIAGSTLAIMKLQSDGLFSVENKLKDYIPELVGNTEYGEIKLRDMLTHQSGLVPFIPFYQKTMKENKLSEKWYSTTKKDDYTIEVAKDVWLKKEYIDTIYKRILSTKLKEKKYVYSDLGYYFIKKIIEKLTHKSMDEYLNDEIYSKLKLKHIGYNPLSFYPIDKIAPTENDNDFRKQIVRGYVHDPGAAMLGGVGGHAGLFSNATDLAVIMQLFLNKGQIGGVQLLDEKVVDQFTKKQFSGNRRAIGFDRPTDSKANGPTCALVSDESYGHQGFTGTYAWSDPVHKISYVFLSNRVYPSAENRKIGSLSVRTEIQRVIYEAVKGRKR
jgi:CubicO group peptidase (beta-lactamase class C family)